MVGQIDLKLLQFFLNFRWPPHSSDLLKGTLVKRGGEKLEYSSLTETVRGFLFGAQWVGNKVLHSFMKVINENRFTIFLASNIVISLKKSEFSALLPDYGSSS